MKGGGRAGPPPQAVYFVAAFDSLN